MVSVPQAEPQAAIRRYSNTAVTLHWLTVLFVVCQAVLGFAFADMADGPQKMNLFTWHKTLGALILLTTLVRLGYRLTNPPPPYSPDLPRWERLAGTWNHWAFYVLLIVMPLTGLTAVSARTPGAFTKLAFGIPLPVIPGVGKDMGETFGDIHAALALVLIALIVLHIAAALKHQFFDRLPAAGRMPPFRPGDH
ncbi:MAG: cytochrome b, partial [Porphyrobacter sp.]|nr:cytochrome b [Porphyrobacter sp.]